MEEILQEIRDNFPQYADKAIPKFAEVLKKAKKEATATVAHDLSLNEYPAVIVDGACYIYDPESDEVVAVELETSTNEFDYRNLESLDPKISQFNLISGELEALRWYGNRFVLIMIIGGCAIAIRGAFLGKVIEYVIQEELLEAMEKDQSLSNRVTNEIERVKAVAASYSWKPTDRWRGRYESENIVAEYVKVLTGWMDWISPRLYTRLCGKETEKLVKLLNLESKPPCTSILFIYPRSSNIVVMYFDVFVPKDQVQSFKNWFGEVDKFSFSEGINIKTTYEGED